MSREARVLKNCKWHDVPFTSVKQGDIFMIYNDDGPGFLKNNTGRNTFEALSDARIEGKAVLIKLTGVILN
jgi:hypothetical protein